ncbi:hypothetical protein ACHAWO_006339 [Cyclotella atomus]|uniref:Vps41 beta-propeller domain-containing protein n=1 Tax=Cyclotella atomus TaxID=382360 RepID=A0ABD3NTA2_9STRA
MKEEQQEEDTATCASDGSQYSYVYQDEIKMPPFKYARIVGCLPRSSDASTEATTTGPITEEVSCSTLGMATVPNTTSCHSILATGHSNGSIRLLNSYGESVLFGSTLTDGGVWYIHPKKKSRVIDICFDSQCGSLAALNEHGDVCIFGLLHWGERSDAAAIGQGLDSMNIAAPTDSSNVQVPKRRLSQISLQKPPLNTLRFTFIDPSTASSPSSLALPPTCLLLDPSYSHNKTVKQLVTGYTDGKVILSKLQTSNSNRTAGLLNNVSSFFSSGNNVKRVDTTIYQGMYPIQCIAWRGSYIAWGEESGIRLFDVNTMSRIAHVDRPSGAKGSLYPTLMGELRPCLVFERCDRLLIGWGDCLMGMRIYDVSSSAGTNNSGGKEKKKVVECIMAWELDCVSCGVVPVDEKHVAVLGLVPCSTDVDDVENYRDEEYFAHGQVAGGDNMLELQIISREDGKSISCDRVPLLEGNSDATTASNKPNVADFQLLSSYATQRMEDLAEWGALNDGEKETIRNEVDMAEFMTHQTYPDHHLRWKMEKDVCTIEFGNDEEPIPVDVPESGDQSTSSDNSVMSDDYVFALSQPMEDILSDPNLLSRSIPPTMIIMYRHDACLVQTRDADDAVSYARSLGKPALALKTALAHRRDVRRHGIDLLVDEYFLALLRMGNNSGVALSFPRLQIAAQSLPILLGGDARMWQRWIFMFARLCGGLFAIREKIPVRDPWLPPFLFEMALEKMLQETCENATRSLADGQRGQCSQSTGEKMADLFLETLRAWGPTSSLRRRIQMHRYYIQGHGLGSKMRSAPGSNALAPFIQQSERDLRRRITQTAFGVLADEQSPHNEQSHPSLRQHISSSDDSLFGVEKMLLKFAAKLFVDTEKEHDIDFASSNVEIGDLDEMHGVVLESLAELELMRERYDRALGYYLAIGAGFIGNLSSIETAAVDLVNTYHRDKNTMMQHSGETSTVSKFGHMLSLIELHQLHHLLLQQNYSFTSDLEACTPIVSLVKLFGLEKAGAFLMESCSPPDDVSTDRTVQFASLPLDLVADQLQSRPKLLYWYLFLLFVQKPDMYVKFATTAVPPLVITDLHRAQFFLFVDYADAAFSDDSIKTTSFFNVDEETPFMSFLVAALPHGGIRPESVIDALEKHRGGKIESPIYARELAFVIEKFGRDDFESAKKVLQIYLLGAKNLLLAVAYAERNTEHSTELWEILITHCTESEGHGALFGSLLEAAAHCGADLSSLVAKIPQGVAVEGLRPKLIAAVTDYRYKVKIHEFESTILTDDKMSIIRELSHLSRRGSRNSTQQSARSASVSDHNQSATSQSKALQVQREKMSALTIPSHQTSFFSLAIR